MSVSKSVTTHKNIGYEHKYELLLHTEMGKIFTLSNKLLQ